jgi:hypothetical protein
MGWRGWVLGVMGRKRSVRLCLLRVDGMNVYGFQLGWLGV